MKNFLPLTLAVALALLPATLPAQKRQQKPFYLRNNGKIVHVESIHMDNKGNYRYKMPGNPAEQLARKEDVVFVWIPKPAEIKVADDFFKKKKYQEAAKAFENTDRKYGKLGWHVYCLSKQGAALKNAKKYQEAVQTLEAIQSHKITCPDYEEPAYLAASKLLGETYIEAKEFDKAIAFIEKMTRFENDSTACAAFILRGDVYKTRALAIRGKNFRPDMEKAAIAYFQAALLFRKAPARPEALYKSWEAMTELKDARAQEFAQILRKEYPENEYTKKLK